MSKFKLASILIIAMFSQNAFAGGISRSNTVQWIALSTDVSTNALGLIGSFVEFANDLPDGDCQTETGRTRIRIEKEDTAVLSLLLTAKTANLKIGFYYATTTDLPGTGGHGTAECQLQSIWTETS